MRITAPFSGTVSLHNINLGRFVGDGDLVNLDVSQWTSACRKLQSKQRRVRTNSAGAASGWYQQKALKPRVLAVDHYVVMPRYQYAGECCGRRV
jgi:hypothetical protein